MTPDDKRMVSFLNRVRDVAREDACERYAITSTAHGWEFLRRWCNENYFEKPQHRLTKIWGVPVRAPDPQMSMATVLRLIDCHTNATIAIVGLQGGGGVVNEALDAWREEMRETPPLERWAALADYKLQDAPPLAEKDRVVDQRAFAELAAVEALQASFRLLAPLPPASARRVLTYLQSVFSKDAVKERGL